MIWIPFFLDAVQQKKFYEKVAWFFVLISFSCLKSNKFLLAIFYPALFGGRVVRRGTGATPWARASRRYFNIKGAAHVSLRRKMRLFLCRVSVHVDECLLTGACCRIKLLLFLCIIFDLIFVFHLYHIVERAGCLPCAKRTYSVNSSTPTHPPTPDPPPPPPHPTPTPHPHRDTALQ